MKGIKGYKKNDYSSLTSQYSSVYVFTSFIVETKHSFRVQSSRKKAFAVTSLYCGSLTRILLKNAT